MRINAIRRSKFTHKENTQKSEGMNELKLSAAPCALKSPDHQAQPTTLTADVNAKAGYS